MQYFVSLFSSPKHCWVKVNISLHRFCVVSDVLCDVVILNHSMPRHVIIILRSPGVSRSSPGAAPEPPCGRRAASWATARMMTPSEALSRTQWHIGGVQTFWGTSYAVSSVYKHRAWMMTRWQPQIVDHCSIRNVLEVKTLDTILFK